MCFKSGHDLFFGPFIDRAIEVSYESETGDGQNREDAGHKTISRLSGRVELVNGAANLAQTKR
jgi:hypothetical protein